MKKLYLKLFALTILTSSMLFACSIGKDRPNSDERKFNDYYTGKNLDRVAFPIGGIGAGMFCMDGTGSISHLSVRNRPEMFNEPYAFAAISVIGKLNGAKVLEGQVPTWKLFGPRESGKGGPGRSYGLPRFENSRFLARFPFTSLELEDKDIPLQVEIVGWSPFIPTDADNSSLPAGAMEYNFKNNSNKPVEAVFSWNSRNFIAEKNSRIIEAQNGFTLIDNIEENPSGIGFTVFVDNNNAVVDHSWFSGGWYDPLFILWNTIKNGEVRANPPLENESSTGASIFVPFKLLPGQNKTITVNFCWYFPKSNISIGTSARTFPGEGPYYKPWYAKHFQNLNDVVRYWTMHYSKLKKYSELFRDAFFSSTLPAEVIEAVAANLTILKSPTILRQTDGKLWGWEGCDDNSGCCHGSCTHVWNYAQSIPHLFPALERTLRETEFMINQNSSGHQNFRANLPISEPVYYSRPAADGQLGGIMKIYRDWRISGNTEWIKELYPKVKNSLDYSIKTWDPKHQGFLEEPQHNTYDIEFWGPNGMLTSFYLGALISFIEISKALGEPYQRYETLLAKGKDYIETELFNGEYFIQKIKWTGLKEPDPVITQSFQSGYSKEALELLKKEGPKYQYGTGCLSDGILGMWIASVCGLDEIIDSDKIKSHLVSVHKYNFKTDLINHVNLTRPTFACSNEGGLLLCTWPKGGELSLPFYFSSEVWTGIEYQVASHLFFKGEIEKGLEIVREVRKRHDGKVRNPFNEYECGHWYSRAMSSYGLLQGLTGVRYDAVDRTLYIDSRIGDFESFISTETGFGNVGLKNGKAFINIVYGNLDVKKVEVSGVEQNL